MKGSKALLVVTTIALLLIAVIGLGVAPKAESQDLPTSPSQDSLRAITVVGVGAVNLVPDVAQVNVGAEARADTVSEAKAVIDSQMVAIHAALKEMGIDGKDIQTSHYSIHYEREPVYGMPAGPVMENQGGYRVSNMLCVTVRDVEGAGDVVDAAVEAGGQPGAWGDLYRGRREQLAKPGPREGDG